jgi:peptidyl-prolyl cis-trans isomerase D
LAEVRQTVRNRLVSARASELARAEGEAKLAAWKTNPAAASLASAQVVSRDQRQNLPVAVLNAALRADAGKLPVLLGVDLATQGYVVVRVNKVLEHTAQSADLQKQGHAQYAQWWTAAENQAYYKQLQERFNTQIKVARPAEPGAQALLNAAP